MQVPWRYPQSCIADAIIKGLFLFRDVNDMFKRMVPAANKGHCRWSGPLGHEAIIMPRRRFKRVFHRTGSLNKDSRGPFTRSLGGVLIIWTSSSPVSLLKLSWSIDRLFPSPHSGSASCSYGFSSLNNLVIICEGDSSSGILCCASFTITEGLPPSRPAWEESPPCQLNQWNPGLLGRWVEAWSSPSLWPLRSQAKWVRACKIICNLQSKHQIRRAVWDMP